MDDERPVSVIAPARTQERYGLTHDSVIMHCPGPFRTTGGLYEQEWAISCALALSDEDLRGCCNSVDQITIVTYSNRSKELLLERSLKFVGIRTFVHLRTNASPWDHRYKLTLLLDWLQSGGCNTDYLLCLDGDDNVIVNPPQLIPGRFRFANCDLLFGATMADAPPSPECWTFENSVAEYTDPWHAHLNSGGFIGRTEFIGSCAQEILDTWRVNPAFCDDHRGFNDQLGWRQLHRKYYPRIKIDCPCSIFVRFDDVR